MRNTSHCTKLCHTARAVALLLFAATLLAPPLSATDPNIVVIVLDDLGIEHVEQYAIGNQGQYVPFTNFDQRLGDDNDGENWLTVGRAWSNPLCSPTRGRRARLARNDATEPFFLYVAHYGVHGPLELSSFRRVHRKRVRPLHRAESHRCGAPHNGNLDAFATTLVRRAVAGRGSRGRLSWLASPRSQ